ncbi:MAG: PepSY-associated TM helix domain-containing protein [Thiogranum sp.]|nr:PepSY-associated TM helix domain-containing protein [Thiogranum sp.]
MSRRHHRHRRFKLRSLYVWHRYMGVSAAVFVLIIAVTGVLLNHTGDLDLDNRHVRSDWILDWYGIESPERLLSYLAGEYRITLMEDRLYLERSAIDGTWRELYGAARLGDIIVIGIDNVILLVTPAAEIIERLDGADGVPAGIRRIGRSENGVLVLQAGSSLYQADTDLVRWTPWQGDPATVDWSQTDPVAPQLRTALQRQYRNEILPLERLVLDLHSGRFFGKAGPWVFDIAALLLILLALSGTLIWLKRKR